MYTCVKKDTLFWCACTLFFFVWTVSIANKFAIVSIFSETIRHYKLTFSRHENVCRNPQLCDDLLIFSLLLYFPRSLVLQKSRSVILFPSRTPRLELKFEMELLSFFLYTSAMWRMCMSYAIYIKNVVLVFESNTQKLFCQNSRFISYLK